MVGEFLGDLVVVLVGCRENGFVSRVILLKGRVEEVTLPVDKVDIIVSEWMVSSVSS